MAFGFGEELYGNKGNNLGVMDVAALPSEMRLLQLRRRLLLLNDFALDAGESMRGRGRTAARAGMLSFEFEWDGSLWAEVVPPHPSGHLLA